MYKKIKSKIFKIIEPAEKADISSLIFDGFIISLIILNVLAIILESYQVLSDKYYSYFRLFEIISVTIFTIEYLLRLWTADLKFIKENKIISRLLYLITPLAIIDLLAILPFYLPLIIPFDLRFLRILRLIRIFRLFKIQRYSKSLKLITKVLNDKKEELFVTVFITFLLLLIASTIMFYIEHDVQPENFPNIFSSFWWAVATLTTVGYGDIYPITGWGKFLSGIIALLGIGLVALPTGIISSGFMKEIHKNKKKECKCPKCGSIFIEEE